MIGDPVPGMTSEEAVFAHLNVVYKKPEERLGPEAVEVIGATEKIIY